MSDDGRVHAPAARAAKTAEATAREEANLGDSDFAWCVSEIDRLRAENAALREAAERLLRQAMGDGDVTDADERMADLLESLTGPSLPPEADQ